MVVAGLYTARPPRASERLRGSDLRSKPSQPKLKARLNLGLGALLPMPRGRQLLRARWSHVREHPPWLVSVAPRRQAARQSGALTTICIWAFDRPASTRKFLAEKKA